MLNVIVCDRMILQQISVYGIYSVLIEWLFVYVLSASEQNAREYGAVAAFLHDIFMTWIQE